MASISSKWVSKMAFDNQIGNHVVRTDTTTPLGEDSGAGPKSLLLAGLAGCSGIDVSSILDKMRMKFDDLRIDVEADLTDDHPRVYSHIRMKYTFSGSNLKLNKIERAVELSHTKYCGVSVMLSKNCPIDYEIVITD